MFIPLFPLDRKLKKAEEDNIEFDNFYDDKCRLYKEMDVSKILNEIKYLKTSLKEVRYREKVNLDYMVYIIFLLTN